MAFVTMVLYALSVFCAILGGKGMGLCVEDLFSCAFEGC